MGERANRRYRPGRGFEALSYRFEVVSDYGAFRDLQRHRLLTAQWQTLGPELGAGVPEELEQAGVADAYRAGLERSREEYERLVAAGRPELAPYALCLGYRIRYVLDMNAREAMHLVELRSGREGHPSYRAVAHAMHAEIARGPSLRGGRDDPRGHRHRAAPGADSERDPHARQGAPQPPPEKFLRSSTGPQLGRPGAVWWGHPMTRRMPREAAYQGPPRLSRSWPWDFPRPSRRWRWRQ